MMRTMSWTMKAISSSGPATSRCMSIHTFLRMCVCVGGGGACMLVCLVVCKACSRQLKCRSL